MFFFLLKVFLRFIFKIGDICSMDDIISSSRCKFFVPKHRTLYLRRERDKRITRFQLTIPFVTSSCYSTEKRSIHLSNRYTIPYYVDTPDILLIDVKIKFLWSDLPTWFFNSRTAWIALLLITGEGQGAMVIVAAQSRLCSISSLCG